MCDEQLNRAEMSTPLLGRRSRRNASPIDNDDSLTILPQQAKRFKNLCQDDGVSEARTCAKSDLRYLSGHAPSISMGMQDVGDDKSAAMSNQKVKPFCESLAADRESN